MPRTDRKNCCNGPVVFGQDGVSLFYFAKEPRMAKLVSENESLQKEKSMALPSRREFSGTVLSSLVAYGLIETLFSRDLFADSVKPIIRTWLLELHSLGQDLKKQKLKDTEFQKK